MDTKKGEIIPKVLIVEDQVLIAADLAMQIKSFGFNVVGFVATGEAAIATLEQQKVDIVLMDINLASDLTGIETVTKINAIAAPLIIYLTANTDDQTFEAARLTKPFSFIGKPFKKKNIERTLLLAKAHLSEQSPSIEELPISTPTDKTIFVRENQQMVRIHIDDILYIQADRSYCDIFTKEKKYSLSMSLKALTEKVDLPQFQRVHRSYVVNIAHIEKLTDYEILFGKTHIPISKTYKDTLMKRLNLIR